MFLDKLRHPRAAEVVKSLQQFVTTFKARAQGPRNGLLSPGQDFTFISVFIFFFLSVFLFFCVFLLEERSRVCLFFLVFSIFLPFVFSVCIVILLNGPNGLFKKLG